MLTAATLQAPLVFNSAVVAHYLITLNVADSNYQQTVCFLVALIVNVSFIFQSLEKPSMP